MHRLDELAQQPEHAVPYFEVAATRRSRCSATPSSTPVETSRGWQPTTSARPVDEHGGLLAWIERIVDSGEALKHYGGDTNNGQALYD
ncbi:MAG: hypothetical protein U0168_24930 [Nannocystaceae bacterium]